MSQQDQQAVNWKAGIECTVYQVSQLENEISNLMLLKKPMIFDLSKVEEFDASFIQLLLAAQLQAKKDNLQLSVEGASEALIELVNGIYCQPALSGLPEISEESDHVS
ncbi:MAG: hypothetical protein DIZ80_01830 [endosymbiont of Galathealinum brachiosum]|uniref:MlaB-like STAS domain-containing protein n=1 Tax=endosymbiont of Galathealinum brachiosum TaxID=2200906 RepID=A0A370DLA6_9GAMM|nr:MAG: hypothetical protein DIZ80_01830 [endosymbiont of Galathealinum brachiosum]